MRQATPRSAGCRPLSRSTAALLLAGVTMACLGAEGSEPTGPDADEHDSTKPPVTLDICAAARQPEDVFVDHVQRGVHYGVCGAARWFDGLFGVPRFDQGDRGTYGRLGVFQGWDRRDNLDPGIRLRTRLALPALNERLGLIVGRGDSQDFSEERTTPSVNPVPSNFDRFERNDWLVGLAYSRTNPWENGFDFGTGIRVATPMDPYVKGSYRHHWLFDDITVLQVRETVFWRNSRGLGSTTEVIVDRLLSDRFLGRLGQSVTLAGDTEGLAWNSRASVFQSMGDKRALVYGLLAEGETGADVKLQNYGLETRFRRRVARQWLFLELAGSLTWPRAELAETRRINPGVSVGFEMYFGPVPEQAMH